MSEQYRALWDGQHHEPSILQKTVNFGTAIVQHIATGMKYVDDQDKQRRLAICQTCEHFTIWRSCLLCSCNMDIKAGWAEQKCPLGKWELPMIEGPLAESIRCDHPSSDMTVEQMTQVIEHCPPGPWPSGWEVWSNVINAHKMLLEKTVKSLPEYPGGHEGRGIVIAAGGVKYFPAAWICVSVLRRLGFQLPIQFWYFGPLEMDKRMIGLVKPLGVECVDAREVEKRHPARILCGWELKPYATIHSCFKEVLFIDADNVPAVDPTFLFDCKQYQEKGAVFWPDLPPYNRKEWIPEVVWSNMGLPTRMTRAFESGQFLVNKEKCWRELMIAKWINDHSDYWYKQVYGDKDTFLLAWHKAVVDEESIRHAMPMRAAGWIANGEAGAIVQHDFIGNVLFQHRCQPSAAKWRLNGTNNSIASLINNGWCFEALEDLRKLWDGRLWHNPRPNDNEKILIATLTGRVFTYRRIGLDERPMRLVEDGRIGLGSAGRESSWSVFCNGQDVVLSICGNDDKPTALFRPTPDGSWRGQWLEYEKCECSLTPTEVPT